MVRFAPPRTPGGPLNHPRPSVAVLGWLLRSQWKRLVASSLVSFGFFGCQLLVPLVIGRAIDDGLIAGDTSALYGWLTVLAVCIGIATATGIGSFVYMMYTGMDTSFRVQRHLVDTIVDAGTRLRRQVSAGELVSISAADARAFAMLSTMFGRLVSSVLVFVLALVVLATISWWFVLPAGLGLPVMFILLRPMFLQLESRAGEVRTRIGEQTGISTDSVAGLRVLRGIGGESHFIDRYRRASGATRRAGIRLGATIAGLEFAKLALPGALLALILWMGARMTLSGTITVGEFVALFGYIIAFTRPVQYAIESLDALTKAIVASGRLHRLHRVATAIAPRRDQSEPVWPTGSSLFDPVTGIRIEPGRLTGIVTADALDAADLFDRLAGYGDPEPSARLESESLTAFTTGTVRSRIQLMDPSAQLFSGPLRDQLDVDGNRTDQEIMRAVHTASAVDVVGVDPSLLESDGVPDAGYDLDIVVGERGRNFSGGEHQRLILARALLADPEILLLLDPASACDAMTEARIAERLARHRAGRTTAIATSAPQMLAVCDSVVFISDDLAQGAHAELLERDDYREVVSR